MNRRLAWTLTGVMILLLTIIIASSNLREIYASQKDFVLGSLLSLAGFAFGKSLDKSKEQRDQWLQAAGSFDHLAKLEGHLRSADERLAEYYWTFVDAPALLTVAHEDLSEAVASADRLRHSLGTVYNTEEWHISPGDGLQLDKIRRDMREALNRLVASRERLATRLPPDESPEVWDVFDVMTTDLLKANWNLGLLSRAHVVFPPDEQARRATNYLDAAWRRAGELRSLLNDRQVEIPTTFEIMASDLAAARDGLDQLKFRGAPQTGHDATPAPRPPGPRPEPSPISGTG